MADVTSWIGPATSLIAAVGALPLAGLVQNRGEARIRNSIASSMKTIKELDDLKLPNDTELKQELQQCLDDDLSSAHAARHVPQRAERAQRPQPRCRLRLRCGADHSIVVHVGTAEVVDVAHLRHPRLPRGDHVPRSALAWRKPPNPPKEKKLKSGTV